MLASGGKKASIHIYMIPSVSAVVCFLVILMIITIAVIVHKHRANQPDLRITFQQGEEDMPLKVYGLDSDDSHEKAVYNDSHFENCTCPASDKVDC